MHLCDESEVFAELPEIRVFEQCEEVEGLRVAEESVH
jgi:hypothetical protein